MTKKEKMEQFIAERKQAVEKKPPRDNWKNQQGFNVVSLEHWLNLCCIAYIPYVPAVKIASVDIDELLPCIDIPDEERSDEVKNFWRVVSAHKGTKGKMLRWDCCSPLSIKAELDEGNYSWSETFDQGFHIADDRAYDLIYEYPGHKMSVWQRPWIQAEIIDRYPVEYRVFVEDAQIVGISNYYVQRDLEWTEEVQADVGRCVVLTQPLIMHIGSSIRFPGWSYKDFSSDSKSFTADFIKTQSGELLFLEGGPPWGANAHPCCFPDKPASEWGKEADASLDNYPIPIQLKRKFAAEAHRRPKNND